MSEPVIETLDEWNVHLALCGCCRMPTCPGPQASYQYKSATKDAVGWTIYNWGEAFGIWFVPPFTAAGDGQTCEVYRVYRNVTSTSTITSTDPEFEPETVTYSLEVGFNAEYNIFGRPVPSTSTGVAHRGGPIDSFSGGVWSGSYSEPLDPENPEEFLETFTGSITFTNPVTLGLLESELATKFADLDWFNGGLGEAFRRVWFQSCVFYDVSDTDPPVTTSRLVRSDYPGAVAWTRARVRWQVPTFHEGTYYKVTWDILDEPSGWDKVEPTEPDEVSDPGEAPPYAIANPDHARWVAESAAWDSPIGLPYPIYEPSETISNPAYNTWWAATIAYNNYLVAKTAYDAELILWDDFKEDNPGWVAPKRTFFKQGETFVWTGAAGGSETPRYSDWYEIPEPSETESTGSVLGFEGTQRRIVNGRFECLSSTDYGNKPSVFGEAVELPDT